MRHSQLRGVTGRSRSRGLALITVMLMLMLLIVIVAGFVSYTASDLRASDAQVDAITTYYLAEAGVDYAIFLITRNIAVFPSTDYDADWDGFEDPTGSIINLDTGQEHIVIGRLSYDYDWLTPQRYCGTFKVSQAISRDTTNNDILNVVITSTGYIKQLSTTAADSPDATASWSDVGSWTVKAQRTVHCTLKIDTQDYIQFRESSTTSAVLPRNQIVIHRYYEKFR